VLTAAPDAAAAAAAVAAAPRATRWYLAFILQLTPLRIQAEEGATVE